MPTPWFPCCTCTRCDGGHPQQFSILVSNVTNKGCEDCDDYNGTFVLDYAGTFPSGTCTWVYTFPETVCDADIYRLNVGWSDGEGKYFVEVLSNAPGVNNILFRDFYEAKPECNAFSDLSLTPIVRAGCEMEESDS